MSHSTSLSTPPAAGTASAPPRARRFRPFRLALLLLLIAVISLFHPDGFRFAVTIVRLPWAVAPLFTEWLERHAPGHRDKVLSRIESMRGGKLYESRWGVRMKGEGIFAEQIKAIFALAKRKAGFRGQMPELSTAAFRVPTAQLSLFKSQPLFG